MGELHRAVADSGDVARQAGVGIGTLRADLRAEVLVTAVVGVVLATDIAGGRTQLGRLFDLVLDGARGPAANT
ncbi:hypothetical protein AB0L06_06680 [Spirillospora sp. NPDC052269]